jgi:nucleoside-diphosphate-sugar epimerase
MKNKLLITGSTGFVGSNFINYLDNQVFSYKVLKKDFLKNNNYKIDDDINSIVHLAGKAHDIKNFKSDQYDVVNFEYTKNLYENFLESNATVFVFVSSVKAVCDRISSTLYETHHPNPFTQYGLSKLKAEKYLLNNLKKNKRVFILRPCMIYGPGSKGNFDLLINFVKKGFPWPLGKFNNKRSFCNVDNLCFVIVNLILNVKIKTGIYNVADSNPLSTNELISIISSSYNKKNRILNMPKFFIIFISKIGDYIKLPLNSHSLAKLTENFIVSNDHIKKVLGSEYNFDSKQGLKKLFKKNV